MRSNERRALPSLAFALLAEQRFVLDRPLLTCGAPDLTAIGEVEAAGAVEARRGGPEGLGQLVHELRAAQRNARRKTHELALPQRELILVQRHLLPSRAQQRVALLEDARELARLAAMRALDLREHRVEIASARVRRRPEQIDILGEERHDDELAGDLVRALACAVEQIP